jgi:phage-related holin
MSHKTPQNSNKGTFLKLQNPFVLAIFVFFLKNENIKILEKKLKMCSKKRVQCQQSVQCVHCPITPCECVNKCVFFNILTKKITFVFGVVILLLFVVCLALNTFLGKKRVQ